MPNRLAIVGCGRSKLPFATPARDLYTGNLFRAARAHVEAEGVRWLILSAYHGLLNPSEVIEPYDWTMAERRRSAGRQIAMFGGGESALIAQPGER